MAERRMFAKTIIDSDAFLDMPTSAQALYFHLGMRADDDGFINNPKKIQRMVGASEDDLKLLIVKKFIIPFESGVVVLKHWKIHNYIQNDRYKQTAYLEEKAMLKVKENKSYTLLDTDRIQDVYTLETQVRLGKDRLGKDNNIYGDFPNEKCADCETFFSKIWKLYPKKRGKGQVSAKSKRKLYDIGFDQISRCIERYKQEIKGKDDQYVMYGSTFFNSGYVDYLDDNYENSNSCHGFNIDDWGDDE